MNVHARPLFLLSLLFSTGAALADDGAILRCRALPAGEARLACYDAIPVGAPALAAAPVPASAAAAQGVPAATAEQRFGLEQVKPVAPPASEPTSIASTIEGNFSGWGPSTLFKLANGQVWRVVDGSSADLDPSSNQKVRIVRNLFGTTFLEVEGSNNSAKVRRVR
jgi:hypothetical protein